MAARSDAAKRAALGRDRQPGAAPLFAHLRVSATSPVFAKQGGPAAISAALREHKARETKGERRLADAARPAQQQRMRHASAIEQPPQLGLCRFMAEEIGIGARRRRGGFGRGLSRLTTAHDLRTTPSRSVTAASTARCTLSGSPCASMTTQRFGSAAAISWKPCRKRSWKA